MELTTDKKNILAYRLLTLGNLRLTTPEDVKESADPDEVVRGELVSGEGKGWVITTNKVLEGVHILGVSPSDWDENTIVLSLVVNLDGDKNKTFIAEYEATKKVDKHSDVIYELHVIEEDE